MSTVALLVALVRNRVHELERLERNGVGGLEIVRRRRELDGLREQLAELLPAA
jgi:hypothetical protein